MPRQLSNDPPRTPWRGPLAVAVVVGALVLWRAIVGREPDGVSVVTPPASAAQAGPSAPPRCEEISPEPFIIGEVPAPPAASAGAEPGEPDEMDPTVPFAVEVGRGTVFDGGFAVGVRRDEKAGAIGAVATLGLDGRGAKLVRLDRVRLRGDLDPPVVAGAGAAVMAAVVEPNAGGRAIKVAKVQDGEVTWGVELSVGRDDSPSIDVASSGPRAVLVWDDFAGLEARHSNVLLAVVDVATMRMVSQPHPVSRPTVDAEQPRIAARKGGYWLAYVIRGAARMKPLDAEDDRELGEAIATSFLEVVPLDEEGAPVGAARAITPKNGHVLSFDLGAGDDDGPLVAWRDDDTPTGSSGGRLFVTQVRLSGVSEARLLAEETKAAGVPVLLPGWISLPGNVGTTLIGALSPRGELLDEPAPERSLGAGVAVAAKGDAILWARPMGQPMRLSVVRCKARETRALDADAGP